MRIRIVLAFICIGFCCTSVAEAQQAYFQSSDQCIACHSNLHTASGQDVSIGYSWRASMMANSARDPYWHAAVRREVIDNPLAQGAIEDKCSTCHMPMDRFTVAQRGGQGQVFANIVRPGVAQNAMATDGVSCTVCHQIIADNFGDETSFGGGFAIDTSVQGARPIYASHAVDAGRQHLMESASQFVPTESTHLQRSEICATCHTLYTHALNESGQEIGEIAEQVPYLEWRHSEYRTTTSCQDCHMPELSSDTQISSVLGEPRPNFSQHVFRGGNAFMLGILNKYRGELGVVAAPQEISASIQRTKEYLASASASITIESVNRSAGQLAFGLRIDSSAGHKLPTAYPSRRAWLHVQVSDSAGRLLFESGAVNPNGSISGNDNDRDGLSFEPHYQVVTTAEQVQIYEPIMGDIAGRVTTGLLRGVSYLKDNRLLPRGFDKQTADHDVAVFGAATDDDDFVGGSDRIRYELDIRSAADGPLSVEVELLYQTIGYRWADNLSAYDSAETARFVRYYTDSAADSAMLLARAEAAIN